MRPGISKSGAPHSSLFFFAQPFVNASCSARRRSFAVRPGRHHGPAFAVSGAVRRWYARRRRGLRRMQERVVCGRGLGSPARGAGSAPQRPPAGQHGRRDSPRWDCVQPQSLWTRDPRGRELRRVVARVQTRPRCQPISPARRSGGQLPRVRGRTPGLLPRRGVRRRGRRYGCRSARWFDVAGGRGETMVDSQRSCHPSFAVAFEHRLTHCAQG